MNKATDQRQRLNLESDPFTTFRDARKAEQAQAARDALADQLVTGGVRLVGLDAKGLPVRLGTIR